MNSTRLKLGVMLAAMLAFGQAHAEFVHQDYASSGDNLVTYQTEANLQWLSLTVTSGMTIEEVLAQTVAGGRFDGWRLATDREVEALLPAMYPSKSFTDNVVNPRHATMVTRAEADMWINWFGAIASDLPGWTSTIDSTGWPLLGKYLREDTGQLLYTGVSKGGPSLVIFDDYDGTKMPYYTPLEFSGVFMVKKEDASMVEVDAPLAAGALGFASVLFAGFRRRKV